MDIGESKSDDMVMERGSGVTMMITEMNASDFDGTESKEYHVLFIYNERDFDTNVEEEPLLSWVVMTTQLTVGGGEYTILIGYKDNLLVTIVDHTLGSKMINLGRMTDTGDRIFEMMKRLLSIPQSMTQPLDMHVEMVEFCEIFQMDRKGQKLLTIMRPAEILDRLVIHKHDTMEDARDLAKKHVIMEMGRNDAVVPVIFVGPMPERHGEDHQPR